MGKDNKKIIYIKMKIVINGLFPLEEYKIDEFILKVDKYDKNVINEDHKDYIFYCNNCLLESSYQDENSANILYNYFENKEYIKIEISEDVYRDEKERDNFIITKLSEKMKDLEKRMRLITNITIGLPITEAIKALHITDYETFYNSIKKDLLNGKTNLLIKE